MVFEKRTLVLKVVETPERSILPAVYAFPVQLHLVILDVACVRDNAWDIVISIDCNKRRCLLYHDVSSLAIVEAAVASRSLIRL